MKVWLEILAPNVAATIVSEQTLSSFKTDITDCSSLVCFGPLKRRRADEFICNAVATEVIARGLAVSSGAFARAHPKLLERSDRAYISFDLKFMKSYLSAGWLNFNDTTVCSIAYDGFRAGMPVVENLGVAVYDVERRRSAFAPLMDRPPFPPNN